MKLKRWKTIWVKNLKERPKDGTDYIGAWEGIKGTASGCSNLDCENEDKNPTLVGGHVIKVDSDDKSWYITPLCHKCNSSENETPMIVYENRLIPYEVIKDIK